MALPEFNELGDLPEGHYVVSLEEVIARFGSGSDQRKAVTDHLLKIRQLAAATSWFLVAMYRTWESRMMLTCPGDAERISFRRLPGGSFCTVRP